MSIIIGLWSLHTVPIIR